MPAVLFVLAALVFVALALSLVGSHRCDEYSPGLESETPDGLAAFEEYRGFHIARASDPLARAMSVIQTLWSWFPALDARVGTPGSGCGAAVK